MLASLAFLPHPLPVHRSELCSLQWHKLRVLAHHTRTTVLDGLVGDGELTQVVADHLLGSFLIHGTSEED